MVEILRAIRSRSRLLVASIRSVGDPARLASIGVNTFTFGPSVADELFANPRTVSAAEEHGACRGEAANWVGDLPVYLRNDSFGCKERCRFTVALHAGQGSELSSVGPCPTTSIPSWVRGKVERGPCLIRAADDDAASAPSDGFLSSELPSSATLETRPLSASQFRNCSGRSFWVAEDRPSRYEHLGASRHCLARREGIDPTIDFDCDARPLPLGQSAQPSHFCLHRWEVPLFGESRIDGHHQDRLDEIEYMAHCGYRRSWVKCDARVNAEVDDSHEYVMELSTRLGVNNDQVAASVDEGVHVLKWLLDHQVGFEGQLAVATNNSDRVCREPQIRHEAAVHDVPLDAVRAREIKCSDRRPEVRRVSCESGGHDPRSGWDIT